MQTSVLRNEVGPWIDNFGISPEQFGLICFDLSSNLQLSHQNHID